MTEQEKQMQDELAEMQAKERRLAAAVWRSNINNGSMLVTPAQMEHYTALNDYFPRLLAALAAERAAGVAAGWAACREQAASKVAEMAAGYHHDAYTGRIRGASVGEVALLNFRDWLNRLTPAAPAQPAGGGAKAEG